MSRTSTMTPEEYIEHCKTCVICAISEVAKHRFKNVESPNWRAEEVEFIQCIFETMCVFIAAIKDKETVMNVRNFIISDIDRNIITHRDRMIEEGEGNKVVH